MGRDVGDVKCRGKQMIGSCDRPIGDRQITLTANRYAASNERSMGNSNCQICLINKRGNVNQRTGDALCRILVTLKLIRSVFLSLSDVKGYPCEINVYD